VKSERAPILEAQSAGTAAAAHDPGAAPEVSGLVETRGLELPVPAPANTADVEPHPATEVSGLVETRALEHVAPDEVKAEASGMLETRPLELPAIRDDDTLRLRTGVRAKLSDAVAQRWRLVVALIICVASFGAWRAFAGVARAPTLEQSLTRYLGARGYTIDPQRIVWLRREPNWLGVRPALLSAKKGRELHDIYYADVRVSGQTVVDVYLLTDVTRTSSADEDLLVGTRSFIAYAARVGTAYDAVVLLDTRGEPTHLTRHWPWYAKLQNSITNLQDTGRIRAFGVRRYNFETPAGVLALSVDDGLLHVIADGEPIVIHPRKDKPIIGGELVEFEPAEKGQPGLITWVVDTVRRVPAIGRAPIDWLEHTVFGVTDKISRAYHEFVKTDTAAEVKQALQVSELPKKQQPPEPVPAVAPAEAELAAQEVAEDIGWPAAPLSPVLPDKVQGEGVWLPVSNDPFAAINPNGPPLFYQTFIRVDPERVYTRVYVTMWDPRQVQLGIVMGTKEPESATGETGTGMIPRDPYVLSHLVGAFNGGFQAMHGEFGMMAGKRVYLPPKPYAATVAIFEDGTTGMGSWPGPGRHAWDESFANSQIPANMIAMRQNLTSVIEGQKLNPWQRWWWGAAPEDAAEQTYIHRSGLCVTREGFLAYFWGESMGPSELGKAMLATRCERGMHLDMNGKHTGFEFYQPFTPDQVMPDIGRPLRPTEYEGPATEMHGMRYRARLAVTTMTPLRFPRYLNRDPRDYFYLTRKPTLPGADLQIEGQSLPFSTRNLPSAGFPHPFARVHVSDVGWLVRIDPTRAVPKPLADESLTRTLAQLTFATPVGPVAAQGGASLFAHYLHGRLRAHIGAPPADGVTLCVGPLVGEGSTALAGIGVDDEGFLVYAEVRDPSRLLPLLAAAGVTQAIALGDGRLVLDAESGPQGVDGQAAPVVDEATSLSLMAETRPRAKVLFADVTPMPYSKWGGMQDQRVRYFPTHPARFKLPEDVK
jgi:hypothetical protein